MKRLFWFVLGAGVSAYVVVKGQEYYRRLTPPAVAEEIERRVGRGAVRAVDWVQDFAREYSHARQTKRAELMALLTTSEEGRTR